MRPKQRGARQLTACLRLFYATDLWNVERFRSGFRTAGSLGDWRTFLSMVGCLFFAFDGFFERFIMTNFFFWSPRLREALSLQIDGMPRFFLSVFTLLDPSATGEYAYQW